MCRRFYFLGDNAAVQRRFPQLLVPHPLAPRYNIAPQQPVAVISNTNRNYLDHFLWGLVPSWAKEPGIGNRMTNVPAELLTEKPTFRTAFRRRRCLLPADGFYGQRAGIPVAFHLNPPSLFAFAGIWDVWYSPDGSEIFSCAIVTTNANAVVAPYSKRMPVILDPASYETLLRPSECSPKMLEHVLVPYPASLMAADHHLPGEA